MSERDDGGPAFPGEYQSGGPDGGVMQCFGMTLRDYFAAKAMQAMINSVSARDKAEVVEKLPTIAYQMADSMLKARKA